MRFLRRALRLLSLVVLAVLGTSLLMYVAPGYFSDAREMDAAHAGVARADLVSLQAQQSTLPRLLRSEIHGWLRGDLGTSRQYGTPVSSLIAERSALSAKLLLSGVALGWLAALLLTLPLGMQRSSVPEVFLVCGTALLLAVPAGLLATLCMVTGHGGPVLVLALLVGVRDIKLLQRMARTAWAAPYILHARAQGISTWRILGIHVLASLRHDLLALAVMSFTLALSALVPVEVIFDHPGLGQLAWSAAMNRDLPVLTVVTAIMAMCVGLASLSAETRRAGAASCA